VLSDAEALCSRVAILAKGRLVTSGRLSEMLAFQSRGWELEVAGVSDRLLEYLQRGATRLVRIGGDRVSVELPLDPPVDQVLAELRAGGATLVSLNPLRETLEDFFVKEVTHSDAAGVDRGLGGTGPGGGAR